MSSAKKAAQRDVLLLAIGVLPCLVVAAGAWIVVPQFQAVFVNFGTALPFSTLALLATFHGWALCALVPVAAWFAWPTPGDRGVAAVVSGAGMAMLLFLFGLYACYAPIFLLAKVAG